MNPLPTKPNRWRPITLFNLLVGLLFSLSALGQPAFLKEGLVAYYPFNGNAKDASGKANNVAVLNGVVYSSDRFGVAGYAVEFQSNQRPYIDLGPGIAAATIGDLTQSIWIKSAQALEPSNIGTTKHIVLISRFTKGDSGGWPTVEINANGNLSTELTAPFVGGAFSESPSKDVLDGKWHLITAIKSGNSYLMYLDGILRSSSNDLQNSPVDTNKSSLWLGANYWNDYDPLGTGYYKGEMDDVRIYNRALSGTEVKALYDYESTPPDNSFITNGLVAYYPFNGNANDASGNGRDSSFVGTVKSSVNRFGESGNAIFVGSTNYVHLPKDKAFSNTAATYTFWFQSGENILSDRSQDWFCILLSAGPDHVPLLYFNADYPYFSAKALSLGYWWGNGIGVSGFVSANYSITPALWDQYAISVDGAEQTVYINGVKKYRASNYFGNAAYPVLDIGNSAGNTTSIASARGSFDDVRIYNRALSDTEIKALYDYESTSPIQSPVFVSQPVSKTVNSGDNVVLSVGLQTDGTYNYQWQLNEQNIVGATASSLSVNNAVAGVYRYRVIVSNSAGTVISDTATLTVSTPPAPSIVTQPAPKAVQEGANVSFNVVATGQGSIVYQWQFNEQNLPGATSATLNLNGVKLNTAGRYRVLISSQYGVTISDTVTLAVNANPPPTIVTQPLSRTSAEGTQVSLTVTATGLGALTYQWQINNQNIPGATSSTLVLSAVRPSANGNYRVIIGNPYGTTISTEATVAVVVTDADSDGLSDYEELLLGTNANKADTDGDGLSDFAEVRTHGSNPLTTDTDGDGYSDGIEVARDGNPNNRSVTPTGALAVFPAVDVEFYTLNSVKYQLEVSTDMVSWTAQGGVVVGNGGSQNHLVRASKATQFWRLKVVQ